MVNYVRRDKNSPSQECLYGWYPGSREAAIRANPKDVYINLGVRPPKDQSYNESDLLYQYHQSLQPSQRVNAHAPHHTPEQAVKPPWSLDVLTVSNQPEQQGQDEKRVKEFEKRYEAIKNLNRTKSAPVPTHRIILKIPHAQLSNVYDADGELKTTSTAVENQNLAKMTSNDTTSYKSNNSSKTNYVDTSASYRLEDQRVPTPTHGSSITEHSGNNFLQIRGNASTLEIPYQIRPKTSDNSQRRPSTSSTYENQNLDDEPEDATTYKPGPSVTLHFSNHKLLSDLMKTAAHTGNKEELVTSNKNSSKPPIPPQQEVEKKIEFLRAHQNTGKEGKQSPSKQTYQCKVIEAETFTSKEINIQYPEICNHAAFLVNPQINKTQSAKVTRPKTSVKQRPNSRGSMRPQTTKKTRSSEYQHDQVDNEPHYTISDYHRELQLASPDKKPITQTSSQIELAQKYAQKLYNMNAKQEVVAELPEGLSKEEFRIADGHWKEQLLTRDKFLQKRPKYNVKIDPEKVKCDPPAPVYHFNAPETFFYNTQPSRKMCFTINPNFRSEVLNVQKIGLKNRGSTSSPALFGAPVKYRRNYAFAY